MALILLQFFLSSLAVAEPCNCEQYKSLMPLYSLAQDAAVIGFDAFTQGSYPFADSKTINEHKEFQAQLESTIPKKCIEQWKSKTEFKATAKLNTSLFYPLKKIDSRSDHLRAGYQLLLKNECVSETKNSLSEDCQKKLNDFFSEIKASNVDKQVFGVYSDLIQTKNFDGVLGKLRKQKNLSLEAKIKILILLGNDLAANYDNDRSAGVGSNSSGAVRPDEIWNTIYGKNFGTKMGSGGICRDAAAFLVYAANALDLKNAAAINFRAGTQGWGHSEMVFTDPKTGRIHFINYNASTSVEGHQGLGAVDHMSDIGIAYELFTPEDYKKANSNVKPRITVLSPKGDFLNMASGIRPLQAISYNPDFSMIDSGAAFGTNKNYEMRLGLGTDSQHDTYLYGTFSLNIPKVESEYLEYDPGKLSIVPHFQIVNQSIVTPLDTNGLYYSQFSSGVFINSLQELKLKLPKINSEQFGVLKNEIFARMNVMLMLSGTFGVEGGREASQGKPGEGSIAYNGPSFDPEGAIETGYVFSQGDTVGPKATQGATKVSVTAQFRPSVADLSSSDQFTMYLDHIRTSAEARANLCSDPRKNREGCALFLSSISAYCDHFGCGGAIESGFVHPSIGASVRVAGPLTKDNPNYRPGTAPQVSAQGTAKLYGGEAIRMWMDFQGIYYLQDENAVQGNASLRLEN